MFDPASEFANYVVTPTIFTFQTAPVVAIVEANPKRISLLVARGSAANNFWFGPTRSITSAVGITFSAQTNYFEWTYAQHGGLVQQTWYGLASATPSSILVVETVYDTGRGGR